MLRTLNGIVAGEPEDAVAAVNGDEEDFSRLHGFEIELACDGFLPALHDFRRVERRTDGQDRVAMGARDLFDVRRFRPADLKGSYPSAGCSHLAALSSGVFAARVRI